MQAIPPDAYEVDGTPVPCYRRAMNEATVAGSHIIDLVAAVPTTPTFVCHIDGLRRTASKIRGTAADAGSGLLYSVKANDAPAVLETAAPYVDGLGVSSLREARLGRSVIGDAGTIHLYAVAIIPDDAEELSELCDYVTFNSLSQIETWSPVFKGRAQLGLRVNTGRSFLDDSRYDPCRPHSKLGVPVRALRELSGDVLASIDGLHIHTNCDSTDFQNLLETVAALEQQLRHMLREIEWINLGGGYLFGEGTDFAPLRDAVGLLRNRYDLDVIIEPGAAFVRESGYLVASVIDLFDSGGETVAVLDTTVNHMPEVFEYQFRPKVVGDTDSGPFEYILAGLSCLAGDLFGEYRFEDTLDVGSRVVFKNAGAYTLVKAHTFNGIPLPSTYSLYDDGTVTERSTPVKDLVGAFSL